MKPWKERFKTLIKLGVCLLLFASVGSAFQPDVEYQNQLAEGSNWEYPTWLKRLSMYLGAVIFGISLPGMIWDEFTKHHDAPKWVRIFIAIPLSTIAGLFAFCGMIYWSTTV